MRGSVIVLQKSLLIIALLSASATTAATPTEHGWLCVGEQASGFSFVPQQSRWIASLFHADHKYLVRNVKPGDSRGSLTDSIWGVQRFGDLKGHYCGDFDIGFLDCETQFGRFRFNKPTLRFQVEQTFGYLAPYPPEGADTPNIEIGSCSAI